MTDSLIPLYQILDTCAICDQPFTDSEWIDRHTPDNDPMAEVHDYCCPDCNHE